VVAKCRGILGTRKVGHSGTLDPMATGVLVLGVGRGTKLLRFLSGLPKSYEAEIRFGVETDSLDADGEVTVVHDMAPPEQAGIDRAAAELTGDILQVPPMVSAIKVGGTRLHQLAREGKEVAREPRPVTVQRFALSPTADPMVWTARVDCSAGTYVRSLAADLGRALGGGAHLQALRRTAVGPFGIDEARPMDDARVLPPPAVTRVLDTVVVDADLARLVANGRVLDRDALGVPAEAPGPWAVLGPAEGCAEGAAAGAAAGPAGDRPLLAVYEAHRGDSVKPSVVVPPPGR
jgi:tRNA pseudouridine55 synthase